jgi:serine phosphatase RsbU (regulator of sigma subunit)
VAAGAVAAVHLFQLAFPAVMGTWNERLTDRFFALKTESPSYRAAYDDTVVHVDLNNTSLRALKVFHPTRAHYARVIENLGKMNAGVQMVDIIFAGDTSETYDRLLMDATRGAGDLVFGMAFRLITDPGRGEAHPVDPQSLEHLRRSMWALPVSQDVAGLYTGVDPLITLAPLAEASLGAGFLTLTPDADGVIRRIPLVARFENGLYPSFVLKSVCAFLGVPPDRVALSPGKITLQAAVRPGSASGPRDIHIPVDDRGRMRVHFVGPWGRMKHYNFSDIYFAAEDPERLARWRDELSGKIALVSDISTGSADMGQVPIDEVYPLSGVHANAVHTILSRAFLRELPGTATAGIEALLIIGVLLLSFHRSALVFAAGTTALAAVLVGGAGVSFVARGWIVPATQPLMTLLLCWAGLTVWRAVENARTQAEIKRARDLAERELEIGRRIQAGFLPARLPVPAGWEIATYFEPARQVSGDFYDVFELTPGGHVVIVIADVCDHGVGSALFMALTRSLIRAFALQRAEGDEATPPAPAQGGAELVRNTVRQANDYIATTHGETGMFATLFMGLLDPESGSLTYVNGGHEPPFLIRDGQPPVFLKTTGLAVGALPGSPYRIEAARIHPGDTLFLYTDGVTDAVDGAGAHFSRERLLRLVTAEASGARALAETVVSEVKRHLAAGPIADDMTLVAIRRASDPGRPSP